MPICTKFTNRKLLYNNKIRFHTSENTSMRSIHNNHDLYIREYTVKETGMFHSNYLIYTTYNCSFFEFAFDTYNYYGNRYRV